MAGLRVTAPFSTRRTTGEPTIAGRLYIVLALGAFALFVAPGSKAASSSKGQGNMIIDYVIGGAVALLLLGYLCYALIRPDKF